jgi:hypothetical protein
VLTDGPADIARALLSRFARPTDDALVLVVKILRGASASTD